MEAYSILDRHFAIGNIDRRIFGAFIEHMGRAVYHGIYEPSHPAADGMGFRKDVIDLVKPLRIPIIRYPGGNFLSNYNWEDGIGPKAKRPHTTDAAWQSIEPNEIGTDEFHRWTGIIGAETMMAINLGTRGIEDAKNLVEYCNFPGGSKYSDMRILNGYKEPYRDKVWCLGNEMDGPWQVGSRTINDYADIARKTATVLKQMDPDIELVACGSSNLYMPSFGKWEAAVLEAAWDNIDYISLHQYYANTENDTPSYLGASEDMDRFIKTVASICDYIKGVKHSKKNVYLSFDEWNVWSMRNKTNNQEELWQIGPRREEYIYSLEDALLFGSMLITLMKNCDRVKIACLAQLVNVAAPIMTENNGKSWRQTTYYPFLHASNFGGLEGSVVLRSAVSCESYETVKYGIVPYLDFTAVLSEKKHVMTIFAVNRSPEEDLILTSELRDFSGISCIEHIVLDHKDINACNTKDDPDNVIPRNNGRTEVKNNRCISFLPKYSWNVIRLSVDSGF
jgi:alpha-N-arabinofuranosidase